MARDVVLALRAARVLLRDADGRLRAGLHRERGRDRLRLRSRERAPAVGAASRDVRLYGGCGLAEDGLRRHLGRQLRRAGCPHGRRAVAFQRAGLDHGRPDGAGRARVFLDLRTLRGRGAPAREGRRAGNLGAQRAERRPGLALPRRQVLGARRGRVPDLHLRPQQAVRAHSAGPVAAAPGGAEARTVRSIPESKKARAMPVRGQTRYELWKTRLK